MSPSMESLFSKAASGAHRGYVEFPEFPIRWAFEAGLPDPDTFPIDDLVRISERILRTEAADALQYGTPQFSGLTYGYPELRRQIVERTDAARELSLANVMLTSGGVQAITLACRAFLDPGDVIAVEAPTWGAVLGAAKHAGADAAAIPMDDDGLRLDVLEARLQDLRREKRRLKLVYTIDTFNTPTGICLSEARRRQLLDLAAEWEFVVLEDNVYGDLRYEGSAIPTLLSMDTEGVVIKVDSFSKTLAPGLRLGWLTADAPVVSALAAVREDLGVSQWLARLMSGYLTEGLFQPHLALVNRLYAAKRDAAAAALEQHCSKWARWTIPKGGFFFWLTLDDAVDGRSVMHKALAEGVVCRPGERFFGEEGAGGQHLRIAFTQVPIEEIGRGIEVLGQAIRHSVPGAAAT